ncbi:transcriptional repressor [Sphingobacterium faecale]|uniref:Transcriptional repressor n=1 Tax=Sphingobacterium faecale TaxID=2803775 RepID=A0ABS1R7Q8_9SPHI|nr:transcriptional repressor [Sphingobacterium faecale]MBL1410765.1 transcriptional repressor [Sphingobacterium faecale]
MSKTEKAVIALLQEKDIFMDVEEIFLLLNPASKCYSYAAVYHSVRTLKKKGVIVSEERPSERRRYFKISRGWGDNEIES